MPVPEAYKSLTEELKKLPPQQVFLQTRLHQHRYKTLTIPPFKTTTEQLQALKDAYAAQLMTPEAIVRPAVDWA